MLEVLGIKNAQKLVPIDDDQTPKDPVSENMAFFTGKPTKAFIYQDHEAHIASHMAAAQDPKLMQIISQSPMAQTIQAAVTAHITEHIAFKYRQEIEKQLGFDLPPDQEDLPEDIEYNLSSLISRAAGQLLQKDQAEQQMQQIQQKLEASPANPPGAGIATPPPAGYATQMALDAIQILGGNGYINDYPTGRLLRDAKLYEIGAGTSEIRRMLIGRELFDKTA